jgi:hypothetical protein
MLTIDPFLVRMTPSIEFMGLVAEDHAAETA